MAHRTLQHATRRAPRRSSSMRGRAPDWFVQRPSGASPRQREHAGHLAARSGPLAGLAARLEREGRALTTEGDPRGVRWTER